jgi:glycosyltransferase involved in cell wall biosynthesis
MWLNARSPLRRLHYWSEYRKFYREEIYACSNHDAILVTSERDKQILDRDLPDSSKYVIPNGVDAAYFKPGTEKPEPFSLVFTGAMSYAPNSDGMLHFLEHIFPRILKQIPQMKIYIVGSGPPRALLSRASSNVIVTGFVEDVRPFVWRSGIYVVPLRMGGGTRLKVLEAMAMKKPIVTTSIGAEGINVCDGESALLADEPEQFADAVVRLSQDINLQQKLTANGYDLMLRQYEWSVIGIQLQSTYQSVLLR